VFVALGDYEYVFVALGIQYKISTLRIILSSVACPAVQYFYALYQNDTNFEREFENKTSALILSATFVCNISHSKKKMRNILL
jgi:hypothetical protein